MKLSDEQQKKMIEKLSSLKHKLVCTVCGKTNWGASDTIFELREFNAGNIVIGGGQSVYPVVPITCNVCGNTHFMNVINMGILDPQSKGETK